jgi:hypothetical protein
MNRGRLSIVGLTAVVLIGATPIARADTHGAPAPDRRILFDPAPMDQDPRRSPSWRERQGARSVDKPDLQAKDFSYRGLDLGGTGSLTDLRAPAAPGRNFDGRPLGLGTSSALRPATGRFSLGMETERVTTPPPLWSDDPNAAEGAPHGKKPKRRFVPFIGLSAKSPIE